jgi:prefoldin subunit 5
VKKFLVLLLLIVTFLYIAQQKQQALPAYVPTDLLPTRSCVKELHWYLDEIDPQFSLSKDEARQVIQAAAVHWMEQVPELSIQETLDGFPIRFVYDERQQKQLLAARFERNAEQMSDWLRRRGESLQEDIETYNEQQAELSQQSQALQQEAAKLAPDDPKRNELAEQAQTLNAQVAELNEQYEQLIDRQQDIAKVGEDYQDLLDEAPTAGVMEVGQYQQGGVGGSKMTIFAYRDQPSLYLTLLHEFGHALNLQHLTNPDAVMAPQMSHVQLTQAQPALTADDLAAWRAQCE